MKKVTKIEENRNLQSARPKLRVAAYCRVSTDSDAQLESLEAQKQHYENYITLIMIGHSPDSTLMKEYPVPRRKNVQN